MITLAILRHAPALSDGRLAGRRDVDADCSDMASFAKIGRMLRDLLGPAPHIVASPARRCLQTGAALGVAPPTDEALWEQSHGDWEGLALRDLPDLGVMDTAALARHRPPNGESFRDMAARVQPVLRALDRPTLVLGHAGTARAALAMVVGDAALSFAVAPLSLTILSRSDTAATTAWAVEAVNLTTRR